MPEPTSPPATPQTPVAYSAWRRGSIKKLEEALRSGASAAIYGDLASTSTSTKEAAAEVTRLPELRKVPFGNSGMLVTEVCVGTMTWGSFNAQEAEAHAQLDEAVLALGANFIDTAELYPVAFNYGKTTEKWIGTWLAARTAAKQLARSDVIIATKVNPNMIGGNPEGEKARPHGYEADIVERSCRQSIERMQCEYIDLYQLHWPSRDTPVFGCAMFYPEPKGEGGNVKEYTNRPVPAATALPAGEAGVDVFEAQVKSVKRLLDLGLIKHWGLSNENAFGITMFCLAADKLGCPRPVSCQNDFSLLNRTYEGDTWEAAYRFGVVGLPYGCLAGGVLSGKYFDGSKASVAAAADRPLGECRMRKTPDFQPRYGMPAAMAASAEYVALAERYGITPTELALAWAKERPCNASIIIGTTTIAQVRECVGAFKLQLPEECMKAVDELHERHRHPCSHFHDKAVCMRGGWLPKWSHAKVPAPTGVAAALRGRRGIATAAAAATVAAAVVAAARRR